MDVEDISDINVDLYYAEDIFHINEDLLCEDVACINTEFLYSVLFVDIDELFNGNDWNYWWLFLHSVLFGVDLKMIIELFNIIVELFNIEDTFDIIGDWYYVEDIFEYYWWIIWYCIKMIWILLMNYLILLLILLII